MSGTSGVIFFNFSTIDISFGGDGTGERLKDVNLLVDNFTIGKIIEKIYYVFVRFVIIATFGIVRENGFRNGEDVNIFFVVNCLRIRFIYIYFFIFIFSEMLFDSNINGVRI